MITPSPSRRAPRSCGSAARSLVSDNERRGMKKIGFMGAGNMAGALLKGLLAAKLYRPQDMLVSDVVPAQLSKIKRAYRVEGLNDNRAVVRTAQTIILAVKPQIIDQVLGDIQPEGTTGKKFISIAAGGALQRVGKGLGGNAPGGRGMANTPA